MATTTNDVYIPDAALVRTLAQRVTDEHGPSARLADIEHAAFTDAWPEILGLDDGQIQELFEEIRDHLAANGNGRRR